jgi:UDP-N-acetylmuramoylalanine--D-glutamate ligase
MDLAAVSSPRGRVKLLDSWHADWSGLRVAVLGLGETGFSVADTLMELGSEVQVITEHHDSERERLLEVIGANHSIALSEDDQLQQMIKSDPELLIIAAPMAPHHPAIVWAQENDLSVWSDVELGWRLRDKTPRIADWICVTGSPEAAMVADLAAHMLLEGGLRIAPVGGDGPPVLHALRDPEGYDALIVELSATQLRWIEGVSPISSLCVDPVQLQTQAQAEHTVHRDTLAQVYERTQVACVYDRADPVSESMVEEADVVEGARAISYGLDSPPPSGFGVVEGLLIDRGFHQDRRNEAFEIVSRDELVGRGLDAPQHVQIILASAALARSRGVTPDAIANAVLKYQNFSG